MSKGSPWIRWEGGLLVKLSSLLNLVKASQGTEMIK